MATQNSVNDIYLPLTGGTMTGNVVTKTSTDTVTTAASSGSSYTIDLSTADEFNITLTANCTLSFSNILSTNLTRFVVTLVQDGTGSRTVTWPGSVTWVKGTAPVLNTAAASFDTFVFQTYNGGTNVYGYTTGTEPISAYVEVENNGTPVTARSILNFAATGLVATDNSGNASTDITLASGISGWNGFASSGMLAETATNTYAARTITGTASQIDVSNGNGVSGNPTISIDSGYVGQTSITTLGTISTGTWNGSIITGTYGGTGVNNGSDTITLGGNISTAGSFTTSGANALTLTTTGSTNVTLPVTGTLITNSVATLSSLSSVGTITTGTWSAQVQDYTEINTAASTGTSYTINIANGNVFSLTLTGNVTFAFSNVPASNASSITLFLIQDGTGSRTATWPGSVIWPGGTAPTLTTTAGHVDVITMITTNAGTTWRAFVAGLNFAS
jgi:hypothetical protein